MTTVDKKKHKRVMVKCKRGTDQRTMGQSCDSKFAYMLTPEQSKFPSFKCAKCGYEWVVPVGGQFQAI
jgi:hypothetical protein